MRINQLTDEKSESDSAMRNISSPDLDDSRLGFTLPQIVAKVKDKDSKIKAQFKKFIENILLVFFCITLCYMNAEYSEMNQICPFDNDFDCYYRYLLCENDCNFNKPLLKNGAMDFVVEPRVDEFFLKTRLAGMIFKLIIFAPVYAFIFTFALFRANFRFLSIVVVANLLVLWFYRDGKTHGDYTKILSYWLIVIASFFTGLFVLAVISVRISVKGKIYAWIVFTCAILLGGVSPVYTVVNRYLTSCENWDMGLYGERLNNTINCKFDKPNFCLYEFLGDIFDNNRWIRLTCEDREPHWDYINNRYPSVERIGFPVMVAASKTDRQFGNVPKYVLSRLIEVNETNEKDFEVIFNRTPDPISGKLAGPAYFDINIRFNEQLVAERSKLVSESLASNVMVLYIDNMSRAAAFRQLKETMKVLEGISPKIHQFFKYHSITPHTLGNMYPLFYGMSRPYNPNPPKRVNTPSFIHQYKDKGFITGRALSTCALSALDTSADAKYYLYIDEEPFDHMGNGWACDVDSLPKYKDDSISGASSIIRRCAYGKDISEYVLEYGEKFWNTYKEQKKLLWMDFIDFHDWTYSQGKYLDGHLSKFLQRIDMNDTILLIVSDNGQNIYPIKGLANFDSLSIERANPAFFARLPESLESAYGDNLEQNKNQVITAFDLNHFLGTIPNPEKLQKSLFYPITNKTKGCEFVIREQECHCKFDFEKPLA